MSDEKNIPGKSSKDQIPKSNEENANKKTSQQLPEDVPGSKQPQIPKSRDRHSNLEPQTENMEVHHHGHVHYQKKWKEYIFQFLMLFLAVFCGFLAENQREHYIEHQREKQFIQSLIIDVKLDTANLNRIISGRAEKSNMLDSLTFLINSPDRDKHSRDIYFFGRHITRISRIIFIYNDRTMEQLKSSGGLRLIRNRNAADSIIIYDARVRALEKLEERELQFIDLCLPSCYEIFNGLVYDNMITNETVILKPDANPALLNTTVQALPEFNLTLHNVKFVNRLNRKNAIELLRQAIQLLNTLKKEYKME